MMEGIGRYDRGSSEDGSGRRLSELLLLVEWDKCNVLILWNISRDTLCTKYPSGIQNIPVTSGEYLFVGNCGNEVVKMSFMQRSSSRTNAFPFSVKLILILPLPPIITSQNEYSGYKSRTGDLACPSRRQNHCP